MSRQPGTYAIFNTSEGTIVCRLFEKEAPKTVANFVDLAEGKREWTHPVSRKKSKDRLYDGTIFHRVIPNFMIQGGDPAGTGFGGPGYQFEDETKGRRTSSINQESSPWPMPAPTRMAHSFSSQLRQLSGSPASTQFLEN